MPNTTSAKKALKQDKKRRLFNKSTIHKVNTLRKKFLKNIDDKEFDLAQSSFRIAQSTIAKAAKKNVFHWKKAARLISRMQLKFPKLETQN